MGIVSKVLPEAELASFVKGYANTIAENAPLTVAAIKQAAIEALKPESERNLKLADEMVARCFASQDYIEGRTAFMEKRKPGSGAGRPPSPRASPTSHRAPSARGEGRGEGQWHTPTSVFVAAPHPNPLPASGEREFTPCSERAPPGAR